MSDNPFDEDRTVIRRPAPGGQRGPAQPRPPPEAIPEAPPESVRSAAPAIPADGAEKVTFGLNPLVQAAAPLLELLSRLERTYSTPRPAELRGRAEREVRAFERAARDSGVPGEQVDLARYVLCASLDDVAQARPWGLEWASRPLVVSFPEARRSRQGVSSGVAFYEILKDAQENAGTNLDLLELMYLCLSLGFQGQFRDSGEARGRGRSEAGLEVRRENLFKIITDKRRGADAELSPNWQGVQAPYRPARAVIPSWVVGAAVLGILGALFVWFSTGLNAASDATFAQMMGAPLAHMPQITRAAPVRPPPPAPQPPAPDKLCAFLKPEADQGLITVTCDSANAVIRIRNSGLFASGSATVAPSYYRLLERIGEALKAEKGPITVNGYTDNQPIHTVQFPSNYQLSASRAEAARAIIAKTLGDPGRMSAQGHADADPVASNATPEGREQNRRIEVVLRRQA